MLPISADSFTLGRFSNLTDSPPSALRELAKEAKVVHGGKLRGNAYSGISGKINVSYVVFIM